MAEANLMSFDEQHDDEQKIAQDQWVPCPYLRRNILSDTTHNAILQHLQAGIL
jgi:hypothetical protein